ncbi:MAG: siphovirus ReqiPepy6 Gp37-like family protein, partial [Halanaerobiales bacterium]|nr:siphovirus ReqiPepy6 Gp37-like family protein [Halanaerobiales bacterium]
NYIKMRIGSKLLGNLSTTYIADNESLMLLDPEFNLLTYLDDVEYFSWTRRWRRPDSFELKVNRHKECSQHLKVNNYLIKKKGDVLRGGRIRDKKVEVNEEGRISEVWKIKGRGFGNIFNQRIALNDIEVDDGFDTVEVPAETAMKYFVKVNAVNPDDTNRIIPNLKIEEDKGMGKVVKYKARFQKLSDILYDISRVSGMGWDIKFDLNKKSFIFQVLYADLKPEIRLSTNTDSVRSIRIDENHLDSINSAVVAGQGEGSNRMVVKVTEDDL